MPLCLTTPRSGVRLVSVLGLAAGVACGVASAADPDLRKFNDREPPVTGPIYRLGDTAHSPTTAPRGGFDSSGMTLLSQIPLNNFPGVARATGNDCWGYVSPSGREYAIMGLEGGFGFVEITDPVNPQIIATIPGPASPWHDVKVIGPYAYGVSEGGAGIQVMNMTNIDAGQVTLVRNWTTGGYSTTHNIIAAEDSDTLWICGANIGNGGLIRIGLSNPALPTLVGGWTQMYVHDAHIVTWRDGPLAGRDIAFCAAGFGLGEVETGLRVVDVTNPASPQVLATLLYPGGAYAHQVWLSEDRRFLYLNDELDETINVNQTTTRVFNVENPAAPFLVSTFSTGLPAIDHNLYVHNGMIFQSNYRSGLRVFDALDPANPVPLAYFDTYPGSDSNEYNGAWSNYPFFPSGTIIVSDIERGLFVLRLDAEPAAVAVSLAGQAPATVTPGGGDAIDARAFVRDEANPVASVVLMVDTGSGFAPVAATENADGSFSAVFPPAPCGTDVRAYFVATAADGQQAFFPKTAPAETIALEVADEVIEVFADDFSTDRGWTVGAPGDDATTGIWTRVAPNGTAAQPGQALFGDLCFVTGQHFGGGVGSSDIDGGRTTLTSPAVDLSALDDTTAISYWRWYSNTAGASPAADVFRIDISADNGQTWSNVETVGPDGPEVSGGWFQHRFRPADFNALTSQVRLRFVASDEGAGSVVEAALDGFRVETLACEDPNPGCSPADLAPPFGTLNFFDVTTYLAAFNTQDPAADLAPPFDAFNFFDVTAFLAVFNAGCP